ASERGVKVVGVCGGAMMVGTRINDPHRVEGRGGDVDGLGLVGLSTELATTKTTAATRVRFGSLPAPWTRLSAHVADGYEIRYGVVTSAAPAVADGVWIAGNV